MVSGPLNGVRVLEFAGIGPGPFAGTMLSDMGAEVLRIERFKAVDPPPQRLDARGRRSVALDLKQEGSVALCLRLCERADILIEGNRPGVMERLGLGPEHMLARNPALVYGRMTGWGQEGPYASTAGHDINYLALSGALHAIGPEHKPYPPLNIGGDYGGGAMFLVAGVLAALLHARQSGEGQVVDAAMTVPRISSRCSTVCSIRVRGKTVAKPTCSMAVRTFTTPISARTASGFPSVPSSRSFMPSCLRRQAPQIV